MLSEKNQLDWHTRTLKCPFPYMVVITILKFVPQLHVFPPVHGYSP